VCRFGDSWLASRASYSFCLSCAPRLRRHRRIREKHAFRQCLGRYVHRVYVGLMFVPHFGSPRPRRAVPVQIYPLYFASLGLHTPAMQVFARRIDRGRHCDRSRYWGCHAPGGIARIGGIADVDARGGHFHIGYVWRCRKAATNSRVPGRSSSQVFRGMIGGGPLSGRPSHTAKRFRKLGARNSVLPRFCSASDLAPAWSRVATCRIRPRDDKTIDEEHDRVGEATVSMDTLATRQRMAQLHGHMMAMMPVARTRHVALMASAIPSAAGGRRHPSGTGAIRPGSLLAFHFKYRPTLWLPPENA